MAPKTTLLAKELKALGPSRRSALFTLLMSQYSGLAPSLSRDAPDWVGAAAKLAAQGVVGANGQPPSPNALRQMWRRIERDVAKAREAKAAKRSSQKVPMRSREDRTWQPPLVNARPAPARQPLPERSAPMATPPGSVVTKPKERVGAPEGWNDQALEQWDRLQEDFTKTDRKRFGRF